MSETKHDADIIGRLKMGDDPALVFDSIIERYSERLYWHIRRIVVCHEEAEDVLQECFIAAYTKIGDFRGERDGSLKAWLYKIATVFSIKALRRMRRSIFASIDSIRSELLTSFENEIAPDADDITIRLQRAIINLPTKQRLVFNLRYFDELPFEEISHITGQSVATLKTNYHYAVKRIKNEITTIEL